MSTSITMKRFVRNTLRDMFNALLGLNFTLEQAFEIVTSDDFVNFTTKVKDGVYTPTGEVWNDIARDVYTSLCKIYK